MEIAHWKLCVNNISAAHSPENSLHHFHGQIGAAAFTGAKILLRTLAQRPQYALLARVAHTIEHKHNKRTLNNVRQ